MQYNDSWKHKKKNDEIQSATRSKRRIEESLINKIKLIVFDFVKQHLKVYKTLPVGEYTFTVEWRSKNIPWLKKCLKEKQVIIFPDFKKDSDLLSARI